MLFVCLSCAFVVVCIRSCFFCCLTYFFVVAAAIETRTIRGKFWEQNHAKNYLVPDPRNHGKIIFFHIVSGSISIMHYCAESDSSSLRLQSLLV